MIKAPPADVITGNGKPRATVGQADGAAHKGGRQSLPLALPLPLAGGRGGGRAALTYIDGRTARGGGGNVRKLTRRTAPARDRAADVITARQPQAARQSGTGSTAPARGKAGNVRPIGHLFGAAAGFVQDLLNPESGVRRSGFANHWRSIPD